MLKTAILILCALKSVSCFSQNRSLSSFTSFKPESFNEKAWFMDSLRHHFTEFITFSESSPWTTKGVVYAVGLKNDKAFFARLTTSVLNAPENKMTAFPLAFSPFHKFLDSLRLLGFYRLKDESQISACRSQKDTLIDGQRAETIKSTRLTADGVQTTIVTYSAGRYRVTTYYQLQESSSACPETSDWNMALEVRNYLKMFFEGQSR